MTPAAYRCLDHRFTVECDDEAVRRRVAHLLGHWRDAAGEPGPRYVVRVDATTEGPWYEITRDDEVLAVGPDFEACFHHLLWQLTTASKASAAGRLFIHAGAVVVPGGGALLLPGASGSGKTTLTAALVRAGCRLLSDEVAVLEVSTGLVEPFPRPLSFEPDASSVLPGLPVPVSGGAMHLTIDDLGGTVASAAPVLAVAALHRAEQPRAVMQASTPGETVMALAHQTTDLDATGLAALVTVARGARGVTLSHGSVDEAVVLLLELATARRRGDDDDPPRTPARGAAVGGRPQVVHRRVDGLVEEHLDEETVVLDRRGRLHLLGPVAAAVWRTIDGRSPVPADSTAAVEALEEAGLLIPR